MFVAYMILGEFFLEFDNQVRVIRDTASRDRCAFAGYGRHCEGVRMEIIFLCVVLAGGTLQISDYVVFF